jgi:hypothetical protein
MPIDAIDRSVLHRRVAWNSKEAVKAILSCDLIGPNCYECPPALQRPYHRH